MFYFGSRREGGRGHMDAAGVDVGLVPPPQVLCCEFLFVKIEAGGSG